METDEVQEQAPVQDSQDAAQLDALPEVPKVVMVHGVPCEILEGPGFDPEWLNDVLAVHPVTGDFMQIMNPLHDADDDLIFGLSDCSGSDSNIQDLRRRLRDLAKETARHNKATTQAGGTVK